MRKNTIKKKSAKTKKLFVCMLMLSSAITVAAQNKVTYSLNELQKMVKERYPKGIKLFIIVFTVVLSSLLELVDTTVVNVELRKIRMEDGISIPLWYG